MPGSGAPQILYIGKLVMPGSQAPQVIISWQVSLAAGSQAPQVIISWQVSLARESGSTGIIYIYIFFPQLFLSTQELDLPSPGGIHYGFAWRCFPILGLKLKFFGVDGDFPHSPGSTGSGNFLYTIVSRLGCCCKFSPLVSLLDNHMGVRSTRVRTIVYTP